MPGACRERGLTSKPGRGAPSEPAWEVLVVSSSPSSPLHCWKTGQTGSMAETCSASEKAPREATWLSLVLRPRICSPLVKSGAFFVLIYLAETQKNTQHAEPSGLSL